MIDPSVVRFAAGSSAQTSVPRSQRLDTGRHRMKAIVVTDQASGMAGMALVAARAAGSD
jgi:hypothetical protein